MQDETCFFFFVFFYKILRLLLDAEVGALPFRNLLCKTDGVFPTCFLYLPVESRILLDQQDLDPNHSQ